MKPGSTVAGNTHDGILKWMGNGAFEGSILLPDGCFDRRRFLVDNDARRVSRAIKEWEQWKSEVRRMSARRCALADAASARLGKAPRRNRNGKRLT